ncbi:uncharacterized protein LOC143031303 [Oratosquilla oratoria]|uniref:uncharacterized protein LOC143031303 n=1 Tax=Oratosquilla oratoria TaxID=337810 RepID=UPI003F7738C3
MASSSWRIQAMFALLIYLIGAQVGLVGATTWGDVVSHFERQEEVLRREDLVRHRHGVKQGLRREQEENRNPALSPLPDYDYVDTNAPDYRPPPPPRPSASQPGKAPVADRRVLDLLYHTFVDPIRKETLGLHHEERRPSLLEDVFHTVDTHIVRDLQDWAEYLRRKSSSAEVKQPDEGGGRGGEGGGGSLGDGYQNAINSLQSLIPTEEPLPPLSGGGSVAASATPSSSLYPAQTLNGAPLTTIRGVEPVATDPDLLLVTDDAGVSHVVSIDDIVGSLAGLDEETLVSLLFPSIAGGPGEGVDLSRPSRHIASSDDSIFLPGDASLRNALLSEEPVRGLQTPTTTAVPPIAPAPAKPQEGIQVFTLDQFLSSLSTPSSATPAAAPPAPLAESPSTVNHKPQEDFQVITLDQIMASLAQLDDATLAELLLADGEIPLGGSLGLPPTRHDGTVAPFSSSASSSQSPSSSSSSSSLDQPPTLPAAKPLVRTDYQGNVHVYPVDSSGVLLDFGDPLGATATGGTPDGDANKSVANSEDLLQEERSGEAVTPVPDAASPNVLRGGEEVLAFLKGDRVIPLAAPSPPQRPPPSIRVGPDLTRPQSHTLGGTNNAALPLLLLGSGRRPNVPSSLNTLTPASPTTKAPSRPPPISHSLSSIVSSFLGQTPSTPTAPPPPPPPSPTGGHLTPAKAALAPGRGAVEVVVRQRDSFPYSLVGGTTIELPRPIHYTGGGRASAQRRRLQVGEEAEDARPAVQKSSPIAVSDKDHQGSSSESPSLWSFLTSWWSPSSSSLQPAASVSLDGPKAERRSSSSGGSRPVTPAPSSSPVVRALVGQDGIPDSVKATLLRQLAAKRVRSKVIGAIHDQLRAEAPLQKKPSSRIDGSISSYTHYEGEIPHGSSHSVGPSPSHINYHDHHHPAPYSSSSSFLERDPDLPLFDLYLMAEVNKISKFGKDDYSFRKPLIGDPAYFVNTEDYHHHHHQGHPSHHHH